MKKYFVFISLFLQVSVKAQDINYAHKMVDTLTNPFFWGRGYTNNGLEKAANFLINEYNNIGLKFFRSNDFVQNYSFNINTFPNEMNVVINGKLLIAGQDYIVAPQSKSLKSSGNLLQKDSVTFIDKEAKLIITLEDKLTWSVAQYVEEYTQIIILKKAVATTPISYKIHIDQKLIKNFKAKNIIGYIKGTTQSDTFLVLSAHYDHLGGMGKSTFFPGANDNASGVALLLNIAKYYANHPSKYSIAFILFSGEEAGLLGSKFFVENPLIPLQKIKFLINTDLAGTGNEGIMVVNATEFTNQFNLLQQVNNELKLLTTIKARGKAANSDHYFFTQNGVPSFFIYTLGGIKAYHDIYDKYETLPLNEHIDLHTLITSFFSRL